LESELANSNHLVQRLIEVNQASTHAASLQADLNRDLLSFSRTTKNRTHPKKATPPSSTSNPFIKPVEPESESIAPIPAESSLKDRITATPLRLVERLEPTPIPLAERLEPTPLVERLEGSLPKEHSDPIDYQSSNPFGFEPTEFDNFPDEKYSPTTSYKQSTNSSRAAPKSPPNFYRDDRRRKQRRH
jgi:hypothetical protein